MKKLWKQHGPGTVLFFGSAAVSVGAGMIFLPAGLIAAGVLAIAWWVLNSLDGRGDEE